MMKLSKLISFSVVAVIVFTAFSSWAGEESPRLQAVRIGYVDFAKALNSVSDGKAVRKRLEDEFRDKQQQLDEQRKALDVMRERIDKDRVILSDDDLRAKEEKYRAKFYELQQMLSSFRREMESKESNLTKRILDQLKAVVKEIGDSEGYALILEKSQEIVLYAPSAEDLTERVIQTYNRTGGGKKG